MNELSERTEAEYETQTVMVDDGEGNLIESTETVAIIYLYITVEHKTAEDMQEEYSFDKNQKQQLAELLSPEYASMWSSVLYGISSGLTDSDEMLLAGTCDQCEVCEKAQGRPCDRPELLRYSIEALGGDVEGCLRHYFHLPMLWGRDGKAPDYFALVGGLLTK